MNLKPFERAFSTLVAAVFLLPFLFFPSLVFPFESGRFVVFYGIIALTIPVYTLLLWHKPAYRLAWREPVLITLGLFFIGLCLTALTGVDVAHSFWGRVGRMDGVLLWGGFALFFCFLRSLWQVFPKKKTQHIGLLVSVAALSGLVGLLQMIDILPGTGNNPNSFRQSSVFGNAFYFSAFLPIPLFLSITQALNTKSKSLRRFFWSCTALIVAGFVTSSARGAFVGLVLGIGVGGVVWLFFSDPKKRWKRLGALAVALLLCAASFFALRSFSSPGSPEYRATHFNDGNVSTRLYYWRYAVEGWLEHPLTGVGYQNFYAIADARYDAELYKFAGTWPTKVHNQLLELLCTTGIFVTLLYLGLLGFFFNYVFTSSTLNTNEKALLTAALVAFVGQDLFGFDTFDSILTFTFLLAVAVPLTTPSSSSKRSWSHAYAPWITVMIPVLTVPLILVPMWQLFGVINKVSQVGKNKRFEQTFAELETAYAHWFRYDSAAFARAYGDLANTAANDKTLKPSLVQSLLNTADERFAQAVREHPKRADIWYLYAQFPLVRAEFEKRPFTDEEVAIAEHATQLAPTRAEPKLVLASYYETKGKNAETEALLKSVVEQTPDYSYGHWAYTLFLVKNKRISEAVPYAYEALRRNVRIQNADMLFWLIRYEMEQKHFDRVIELYERTIVIEPNNLELVSKLAAAYANAGNTQKAIDLANSIKQRDPSLTPKTDAFIRSLTP